MRLISVSAVAEHTSQTMTTGWNLAADTVGLRTRIVATKKIVTAHTAQRTLIDESQIWYHLGLTT